MLQNRLGREHRGAMSTKVQAPGETVVSKPGPPTAPHLSAPGLPFWEMGACLTGFMNKGTCLPIPVPPAGQ